MISVKLQNKNCPRISSEAFTSFIQPVELIKPIEFLIVLLGVQIFNQVLLDLFFLANFCPNIFVKETQ
jgi:hypothetical protein